MAGLTAFWRDLRLCKFNSFLRFVSLNQFYQVLLFQLEKQLSVSIKDLWIQVVQGFNRLLNLARLNQLFYLHTGVNSVGIQLARQARLPLKIDRALFVPLKHKVVHNQFIEFVSGHVNLRELLVPVLLAALGLH